ncbi:MAG: hypothetical protein ABSG46_06890 [Candidatus Binataceae bacterium]
MLDMIQFMAWQLGLVLVGLQDQFDGATNHCGFLDNAKTQVPRGAVEGHVIPFLNYARRQCEAIELSPAVIDRIEKFQIACRLLTYSEWATQAKMLREAIEAELKFRRFAFVPVQRAIKLDNINKDWADVQAAFPAANDDITDAVECYALDKHTACIFHLMRVSEHGLRYLAQRLRVRLTDKGKNQPIEFAEWDKIITAIRNKITTARQLPKGPKRETQLQKWSEAADHCEYMKDNWRNAVSHARKPYDEADALQASNRVHAFMSFLASSL